jgi:hypothetical protein
VAVEREEPGRAPPVRARNREGGGGGGGCHRHAAVSWAFVGWK